MTIITDNVRQGAVKGMGKGTGSGLVPALSHGIGNPDDVVTVQTGSDIFYDTANSVPYGADSGIGGSSWKALS